MTLPAFTQRIAQRAPLALALLTTLALPAAFAADALPSASATGAVVAPGVVTPPPVGAAPGTRVRGAPPVAMTPDAANAPAMVFEADKGRISYAVGMEMARNFRKNEVTIDVDQLVRGLQDGIDGKRAEMGEKELKKILNNFTNVMRARTMTNQHALAQDNRKRGELFLAENRKQPDVHVLGNGVQYRELKAGTGVRPTDIDIVDVVWRGTTLDGKEFDGSETGRPMSMAVAELFNGFHAVVKQMQVGAHWMVWVPSGLAYGERGVGTDIGPNATLVLDLELVGVRQRGAGTP